MKEGYKDIRELARSIQETAGTDEKLRQEDVRTMLSDVRALYERLIVLQYKFQEAEVKEIEGKTSEEQDQEDTSPLSESRNGKGTASREQHTSLNFSLNTEASEVPQNNEDLFSSLGKGESPGQQQETLASLLGKSPIGDLWSEIGINQQYLFTNELFQGSREAFEDSVEKLNNLNDREEALRYLQNDLQAHFEWDTEDQVFTTFLTLVKRRYTE